MGKIKRSALVIGLMALAIGVGCGTAWTAVTIKNISISPSTVYPGGNVTVTADISSPDQLVTDVWVDVWYPDPASPGARIYKLQDHHVKNTWDATYHLNYTIFTASYANGTYSIDIYAFDQSGWPPAAAVTAGSFRVVATIVQEAEQGYTIKNGSWYVAPPWWMNGGLINGTGLGDAVSWDINVPLNGVYLVDLAVENADGNRANLKVEVDNVPLSEIVVGDLKRTGRPEWWVLVPSIGEAGIVELTAGVHNVKVTTTGPKPWVNLAIIDFIRLTAVTAAYDFGFADGAAAHAGDYIKGYDAGYAAGYDAGYDAGYAAGYDAGYDAGYTAGYDVGHAVGFNDGWNALLAKLPPGIRNALDKGLQNAGYLK